LRQAGRSSQEAAPPGVLESVEGGAARCAGAVARTHPPSGTPPQAHAGRACTRPRGTLCVRQARELGPIPPRLPERFLVAWGRPASGGESTGTLLRRRLAREAGRRAALRALSYIGPRHSDPQERGSRATMRMLGLGLCGQTRSNPAAPSLREFASSRAPPLPGGASREDVEPRTAPLPLPPERATARGRGLCVGDRPLKRSLPSGFLEKSVGACRVHPPRWAPPQASASSKALCTGGACAPPSACSPPHLIGRRGWLAPGSMRGRAPHQSWYKSSSPTWIGIHAVLTPLSRQELVIPFKRHGINVT
jgi:hypothetical protein